MAHFALFKRNQRCIAQLELFLCPILVKTEKRGFLTYPAQKKISPKFMTEIIDTIHFFGLKNEISHVLIAFFVKEIKQSQAVHRGQF